MYPSLGTPSLGLEAKFRLGFSMLLLAFVVQPNAQHCHVTRYSRRTNKFSKVKDHGWLIANALRLHGFSVQRTMNLSVVTWKWLRNHPWIFLF